MSEDDLEFIRTAIGILGLTQVARVLKTHTPTVATIVFESARAQTRKKIAAQLPALREAVAAVAP